MLQKIFETNPVVLARLLRDQWNEFLDDYASRRLVSGQGIRLNRIRGAGTVISSTARGGGSVAGGGAAYANYFAVEATEGGVRIFDGGDPESSYCGLTDVEPVMAGTLTQEGGFGDGYVCLRLVVDTTGSTPSYSHVFEFSQAVPNAWEPVEILAEIIGGQVVQRWTGGMIRWRTRFVIGWGRGRYN